jgi:hypothetical protein
MAMEVLSPHAAGNHQALVSEETHDRGMLTRLARAARWTPGSAASSSPSLMTAVPGIDPNQPDSADEQRGLPFLSFWPGPRTAGR